MILFLISHKINIEILPDAFTKPLQKAIGL